MSQDDVDPYRLPRTVVPRRYDLHLVPDLDQATFTGTVTIEVEVTEPVSEIVLNAIELTIDEAWVAVEDQNHDATVTLDEATERATLVLSQPLPAGPALVHLRFAGILNDKLRGFYRSTFTDAEGRERVIATTQFEATDARRAFPCWDEPDRKAVFAVALDVPEDLLAVSNAAQVSSEPVGDGRRRVRFADTMVMSTYLVAFVVGPLEATEAVDVDGVPLRVVHPLGQGHLTAFALESGTFALRHFADYFGRPYPADKLDLVAVPDFAFGAMENLGCVTFREALLLVDPERSTQPELQRVADVIGHELAHMWFGDLVTMTWWNGIWLNEAFATFMEMRCTDAFRPEWDRWTDFGVARSAAFDTDTLSSTRPIEFPVVSPADAEGMFDVLTYEKGAAVVRMLEQHLGEDRFRDGIRLYMERHAHGNTETTDLWDAIEDATGEPVRRIMDTWIFQAGHPSVSVEQHRGDGPGDDHSAVLRLTQRRARYLIDGEDPSGERGEEDRWAVPVLLRWGSGTVAGGTAAASSTGLERVLLDGPETQVELDTPAAWVVANSGGSGFFRVRYGPAELRALAGGVATLTPLERYGLIDDAWASLLGGTIEVATLLDLVRSYASETDLSVWQRVLGVLGSLDRLVDETARPDLQAWTRALVAPALRRLGSAPGDGEPARTATLRGALLTSLGTIGADPEARQQAAEIMAALDAGGPVPADLVDAAVKIMAAHGDAATADDLHRRQDRAHTPQERLRYLGARADLPGDAEADAFLADALTDAVRTQDGPYVLRRALTNRIQGPRAWRFVADRWDEVNARFPSNSIARLLEGIRAVTDPDLAAEVAAFLDAHPVPQGEKLVAQHRERMLVNVALRRRIGAALSPLLVG